jgi:hypothetical protein
MANALYAKFKQALLNAEINLDTDTIKAILVSNAYPQNLATDEFLSGISAYQLDDPVTLTNTTIAGGVFDADDVTFTAVAAGATAEGVVLYKDTGNPATSKLIAYIDTITSFPLATNGGNVTVQWDNGANKIFAL